MNDVNRRRTLRNLAMFTVVVWSIGWIAAGLQSHLVEPSSQQLGLLLWLVAPLVTVLLLGYQLGWVSFPGSVEPLLAVFAIGLGPSLVKNIFEEFAWRGYLTPKVRSLGLNDYVGHACVGVIWAGWHIPYFLYLVDPVALHAATSLHLATFVALAVPALVAVSIVYGELRLLTNSVWPAVLAHAIGNASIDALVARGFVHVESGKDVFVSPGYQGVLSMMLFVVAGVLLHRWRISRGAG